jgi:hypothetical protein
MTDQQKDCFGFLDEVFPRGKEGLREIVPACFDCLDRKECLREALNTEKGLAFRSELVDRSPATGLVERLKRWSERKDLSRRLKRNKGMR